ncbi:pentapeptide repeat-containing protein [Serratia ureilytica]
MLRDVISAVLIHRRRSVRHGSRQLTCGALLENANLRQTQLVGCDLREATLARADPAAPSCSRPI